MNVARIFTSAVVRKIAYVFVALAFAWVGIGRAQAATATGTDCLADNHCTQQEAYEEAEAYMGYKYTQGVSPGTQAIYNYVEGATKAYCVYTTNNPPGCGSRQYKYFGCSAPQVWNEAIKQCFDPAECTLRPDLGAGHSASASSCSNGCEFVPAGNSIGIAFGSGPMTYPAPSWKPTGQTCSVESAVTLGPDCTPLGGGQTACKKPSGEHCHTASTGREICWKPGQTGEQTDGPNLQKTNPGPTVTPPANPLPNGDTLSQVGQPVTTTITNTTNNTTSTTTTTTYGTTNGTNAGGTDQGQATGTAGGTGGGTGTQPGEGDGNGAGGGGSCETPPTYTGDPLLGAIYRQAWETRCAIENGKVEGLGSCALLISAEVQPSRALCDTRS